MSQEQISHLQLIRASGEDAKSFLQGQLTNDINTLEDGWQYSAYCSPKGRAFAVFTVWEHNDSIFMLCEKSIVESVLKRLRMYVMRSKVAFEEIDALISGVFTQAELDQFNITSDIDATRFSAAHNDNMHVLAFGGRSLIINTKEPSTVLASNVADSSTGHKWIADDIKDALPRVTVASSEMFIPQMLNMDLLNGISFKKGCYTGQEIIARMKYLGKLKQRSFLCKLNDASHAAEIGEKVVTADGKTIGHIVNAVRGSQFLVAALRFDPAEQNSENASQEISNYGVAEELALESGPTLKIITPQPYALQTT